MRSLKAAGLPLYSRRHKDSSLRHEVSPTGVGQFRSRFFVTQRKIVMRPGKLQHAGEEGTIWDGKLPGGRVYDADAAIP